MDYTNTITITMNDNASSQMALKAAANALVANAELFNKDYKRNPSEALRKVLTINENMIEAEGDFFTPENISTVIEVMLTEIAATLKESNFTCTVYTDSTYSADEIEANFTDGLLHIKHTYLPCGHVEFLCCEECGEEIVSIEEFNPKATYYCPECGEEIDLHDQYAENAPVITEITKNI